MRSLHGHTDVDADVDADRHQHSDIDADADIHQYSNQNADGDPDLHTYTDADIDLDADANADPYQHPDLHPDANVDQYVHPHAHADDHTNADGDRDADAHPDPDLDADPDQHAGCFRLLSVGRRGAFLRAAGRRSVRPREGPGLWRGVPGRRQLRYVHGYTHGDVHADRHRNVHADSDLHTDFDADVHAYPESSADGDPDLGAERLLPRLDHLWATGRRSVRQRRQPGLQLGLLRRWRLHDVHADDHGNADGDPDHLSDIGTQLHLDRPERTGG